MKKRDYIVIELSKEMELKECFRLAVACGTTNAMLDSTGNIDLDILKDLLVDWKIDNIGGLNESAEKARDYLMKLPSRLQRITDRLATPDREYNFKWVKS